MKDEIKEIYLSNLEWTKTHDNMGGVMGNVIFKNSISLKEFEKIVENTYVILCDKDYITNLQEKLNNQAEEINRLYKQREKFMKKYDYLKEENESLKELNVCVGCNNNPDYKSRNEKTIELLNRHDIDTGDIYYKYNGRFVKSELKERIREILGGDEE